MATVYIRNVDQAVIDMLDEKAEKAGMSRSEYCKNILTASTESDFMQATEQRYTSLVKAIGDALGDNTNAIKEILDRLNDLEYAINHI